MHSQRLSTARVWIKGTHRVSDGHQLMSGVWGQRQVQIQLSHGALSGPSGPILVTSPSHPQFLICEMGTRGCCEEQPLQAYCPGLMAWHSNVSVSLARAASVVSSIQQSLAPVGCPRCAFHVRTWMSTALRGHLRKPETAWLGK